MGVSVRFVSAIARSLSWVESPGNVEFWAAMAALAMAGTPGAATSTGIDTLTGVGTPATFAAGSAKWLAADYGPGEVNCTVPPVTSGCTCSACKFAIVDCQVICWFSPGARFKFHVSVSLLAPVVVVVGAKLNELGTMLTPLVGTVTVTVTGVVASAAGW